MNDEAKLYLQRAENELIGAEIFLKISLLESLSCIWLIVKSLSL